MLGSPTSLVVEGSKWAILAPPAALALTAAQESAVAALDARAALTWPPGTAAGSGGGVGGGPDLAAWLSETRASFRCLWTSDWDAAAAWTNLEKTVAWRRTVLHPRLSCAPCVADSRAHCFVRLGKDRWNRPIVYFAPARCRDTVAAPTIAHAAVSRL